MKDKKHDKDEIIGLDLKQQPYMMVLFLDLTFVVTSRCSNVVYQKLYLYCDTATHKVSSVVRVWSHCQRANDIDSNTYENAEELLVACV